MDICTIINYDFVMTYNDIFKAKYHLSLLQHSIILDYHNVFDTLGKDISKLKNINLPDNICILAYVNDKYRLETEKHLVDLAYANIITTGILVFRKGEEPYKNCFISPGSKAWIIKYIFTGVGVFIDDKEEHCASVKQLKLLGLNVYHFKKGDNLLSIINKYKSIKISE